MSETDRAVDRDRHDRPQDERLEDSAGRGTTGRGNDDRRQEVKPTEKRVPNSPEPEEDSVRKGQEKLERVKPY